MLYFDCDYNNGAHPEILKKMAECNDVRTPGYGEDEFCKSAQEKIKAACECPDAAVYFLSGGTQTNSIIISTMLKQYEGVVAATTGHVSLHEAGAIEYTGHKVLEISCEDGKIHADTLSAYLKERTEDGNAEHMVFPGMVYISFPTEYGTIYSKKELTDIHDICQKYDLPLFIDGARLGYGLVSPECDLTMAELSSLCEVFYIGGTKIGAYIGEAVVFTKNAPLHFVNLMKKHGALLAKGRLIGIQFDTLFTNGLYLEISKNAIDRAMELKKILLDKGYEFYLDSPTNQQFVVLTNAKYEELKTKVAMSFWEAKGESHTVVRFATSWATTEDEVKKLAEIL